MPAAQQDPRALMTNVGLDDVVISVFERQIADVRAGLSDLIYDADIEPITPVRLPEYSGDPSTLARTAMIRLNGGLATSMGMDHAKSLLPIHDGLSFLDIIARQVTALRVSTGASLPVSFLNSFRTSDDTLAALAPYPDLAAAPVPLELIQNRVPKLRRDDLTPVRWPDDPSLEWCPPGHGDIYTVLHASGYLDTLAAQGYEYVFVANADNLAAVPHPRLAAWFAESKAPFAIEVVRKTPSDRKAGHFARRKSDGRLILRETSQTPPDEVGDIERHGFTSTNNIWFRVDAMRAKLAETNGDLRLAIIINRKTVDPADPTSTPVVQLETAMGAAIEAFDGAAIVEVGRDRFVPVKTTDDLLVVRSDCYELSPDSVLQQVAATTPFVALDGAYRLIDDFDERFPAGPPSLVNATKLVVSGDWTFGADVKVVGVAELGPEGGKVPDGTVLGDENA